MIECRSDLIKKPYQLHSGSTMQYGYFYPTKVKDCVRKASRDIKAVSEPVGTLKEQHIEAAKEKQCDKRTVVQLYCSSIIVYYRQW